MVDIRFEPVKISPEAMYYYSAFKVEENGK
jgi:hypothetical protein